MDKMQYLKLILIEVLFVALSNTCSFIKFHERNSKRYNWLIENNHNQDKRISILRGIIEVGGKNIFPYSYEQLGGKSHDEHNISQ